MLNNNQEMLDEIQKKRQMMIDSAKKSGFTSIDTIRHSQELDKLIYQYQCTFQEVKEEREEIKFSFKQMIMIWPKALARI